MTYFCLGDLVWIYFSSFTHYSLVEPRRTESGEADAEVTTVAPPPAARVDSPGGACAVELRIWDGGGAGEPGAAPLGRFCDSAPALCARAALANATRSPRPCAPPDGYVSGAPLLALAATSAHGTATHPLAFALHYEFVDARLEGTPLAGERAARAVPTACARDITVPGLFSSPRNALWFGRGGARRLRCVYRVHSEGTRVALELAGASFGRSPRCMTRADPATGRLTCVPEQVERAPETDAEDDTPPDFDDDDEPLRVPHLKIFDSPWPGYRVSVPMHNSICQLSTDEGECL